MTDTTISLAEAKAQLSQLVERALAGESVIITKRGKPVVRLTTVASAPKPIDADALRALTNRQRAEPAESGALLRTLRDDARY